MMTTAGVVTMGGVATTVAGTVAGDILAGVITMGGGILAGGMVGGTTNPRELTFARVCQRSDVSLVPYSLASFLGVARRPPQGVAHRLRRHGGVGKMTANLTLCHARW